MNKGKLKTDRGITLVALIIIVAVILIIVGTTVYTSLDRFEINRLQKMYNDIELLSDKVNNYYLQYNGLPLVKDTNNNAIQYTYTTLDFEKNVNDSGNYYIIDLTAMEGISLNYGEEGFKNINNSDDVYIINEKSRQIYYVKGVKMNNVVYYTILKNNTEIDDAIPPTKPEIKVISGTSNSEGIYTSEVKMEIIPGKDSVSGIKNTVYSINDGEEKDIATLENNILDITSGGTYNVKVKTADKNDNISEISVQIIVEIIKKAADIVPKEYGKIVTGYIAKTIEDKDYNNAVENWRIFYADETNIYLIADNYININYIPSKDGETLTGSGSKLSFNKPLLEKYSGSSSIEDERFKKLNNSYFSKGYSSKTYNMSTVAYMMDEEIWGGFAGKDAEYAIGGPTIEMLMKSYGQKYNVDYKAEAMSNAGYKISTTVDEQGTAVWEFSISDSSKYLNSTDRTYVIASVQNAYAMWIASPSAENEWLKQLIIDYSGFVGGFNFNTTRYGFRPLVCLNSNIKLEQTSETTYEILTVEEEV